jgi:hypothetical protein
MSEFCGVCGKNLAVVPVLKTVKHPKDPTKSVQKHVHCKPLQLVLVTRVEGSTGEHPLATVDAATRLGGKPTHEAMIGKEWRICGACCEGKSVAEILAVLIDSKLEAGV